MTIDNKNKPDYDQSLNEKERQRQQIIAQNKKASEGVLVDLAQAGFPVEWVSDLYNLRMNYRSAVPILLKWLPLTENLDVKESIVRALTVNWAKHLAARPLAKEYRKLLDQSNIGIKWAIANALSVVADDSVLIDIEEFVYDLHNGYSRQMLALSLGNMKDPKAVDILISLLDDTEVAGHAIIGLGKLKSKKSIPEIERFQNHPSAWIRKEAKKAISKIEKA